MAAATEPRREPAAAPGRGPGLAWLPLLAAIAITLAVTIYPPMLTGSDGHADHTAAMLAMWSMSAGFVRGTGFLPRNRVLRLALSGWACLFALGLTVLRLMS